MTESLAALLPQLAAGSAHTHALGFAFDSLDGDRVRLRAPWREDLVGDPDTGVFAGGLVTTLLDHAGGLAVWVALGRFETIATLDLRVDYMRPAAPRRDLMAEARCYRLTRSIAFVRAWAFETDPADPVAAAQGAYMLSAAGPAPEGRRGMTSSALLDRLPYARFLGLETKTSGDVLTVVMPFADRLIGNPFLPALHGGSTAALLELTAVAQVAVRYPALSLPRPINVTVTYLRPGRPMDTLARALISKAGRRVAHVTAQAWQDDPATPIATLSAHFLLRQTE